MAQKRRGGISVKLFDHSAQSASVAQEVHVWPSGEQGAVGVVQAAEGGHLSGGTQECMTGSQTRPAFSHIVASLTQSSGFGICCKRRSQEKSSGSTARASFCLMV